MSTEPKVGFVDQRDTLRRRMLAQRQLIAYQLEPVPRAGGGYPRSKTMRFLGDRKALAAGLLAVVATLWSGSRFIKPVLAVAALIKLAGAVTKVPTPASPPRSAP